MKKILLTLAAALLVAPVAVLAQKTAVKTHFKGERITGVAASSAFDVVLVKSNQTKAVVEVNDIVARYVEITRDTDGIVSIGTRNWDESVNDAFNRLPDKERVMRLTLYMPGLNTVRLSGASELSSSDSFTGENVDISLSGASEINEMNLIASRVKLQCSGASEASLILPATRNLVLVASGASKISIAANGLAYSKLGVSGASNLTISGDGEKGDWTVSGASQIDGEEFAVNELNITASGVSSARVNVTRTLSAKTSGISSIRYAGKPTLSGIEEDTNSSVGPL